jgi:hypothetical protein
VTSNTPKAESDETSVAPPPPLPGEGTPEGEKLLEAHRAFETGDYRAVRAICNSLVEAPAEDVAGAAAELRRRTEVDPVQTGVVLACVVVLAILVYTYVL